MEELLPKFSEKFNDFLVKLTNGMEGFKYKGNSIGPSALLIMYIGSNPNSSMTDITHYLNLIPSAATRRIDKLVNYGIIERALAENDRRLILLNLSTDGLELYNKFLQKRLNGLKKLAERFDKEELKSFLKILDFLIETSDDFLEE